MHKLRYFILINIFNLFVCPVSSSKSLSEKYSNQSKKKLKKIVKNIGPTQELKFCGGGTLIIEPSSKTSLTIEISEDLYKYNLYHYNEESKILEIGLGVDKTNDSKNNIAKNETLLKAKINSLKKLNKLNSSVKYHLTTPYLNKVTTNDDVVVKIVKSKKLNEYICVKPKEKSNCNIFISAKGNSIVEISSDPMSLSLESNDNSQIIIPHVSTKQYDIRAKGKSSIVVKNIHLQQDKAISMTVQASNHAKVELPSVRVRQICLNSKQNATIRFTELINDNMDIIGEGCSSIVLVGSAKKANIKMCGSAKLLSPKFVVTDASLDLTSTSIAKFHAIKIGYSFISPGSKFINTK